MSGGWLDVEAASSSSARTHAAVEEVPLFRHRRRLLGRAVATQVDPTRSLSAQHPFHLQLVGVLYTPTASLYFDTKTASPPAAHGRFNRICQVAPYDRMLAFLTHPSPLPKRHLDRFSRFCTAGGRESLYFTIGRPFHPQNYPFAWGIWTPSNTWFIGPT